jgi:4'-phosphopantetheinyl transferase
MRSAAGSLDRLPASSRLPLDCQLHVWWIRPASVRAAELARRFDALLSAEERERCRRFIFPDDSHTYLVAHALVRTALSNYTGTDPAAWVFTTGRYGRPEIAGPPGIPPLRFSLSHTKDLAAVALSMHDVGLDVERVRPTDCLALAERFFAPVEAAHLASLGQDERSGAFFEYWTLKEAYVKATGLGLSMPLDSFHFELGAPPVVSFADGRAENPSDWHFAQLSLQPGYAAAVAIRSGAVRPSISVREWGW